MITIVGECSTNCSDCSRETATITGDNSTADFLISHTKATRDVIVQVYKLYGDYGEMAGAAKREGSILQVKIHFNIAPTVGQNYKVIIL